MAIRSFFVSVIPFDGSVAVAGYIVVRSDGLPPDRRARKSAHPRSVVDRKHLALVDVVNFGLSIGAPHPHYLVVGVDPHRKYLSVDIPKEIDDSSRAEGSISELYVAWIEMFILLDVLLVLEDVVDFLE